MIPVATDYEKLGAFYLGKEYDQKAQSADNGDLVLETGDRISHVDFGEGRVMAVTGEGARRIAEVLFDTAGRKKLLIKVAPIEKKG